MHLFVLLRFVLVRRCLTSFYNFLKGKSSSLGVGRGRAVAMRAKVSSLYPVIKMESKESCFCLVICVLMSLTCFCASVPNFNVIFFSVYRPKLLVVAQHPVEVLCHLFVGNFVLLNGSLLSEAVFLIVGHLRNALEFINQACTPHI